MKSSLLDIKRDFIAMHLRIMSLASSLYSRLSIYAYPLDVKNLFINRKWHISGAQLVII